MFVSYHSKYRGILDCTGHTGKYIGFRPKNKNRPVFEKKKTKTNDVVNKNKKPDSSDPHCHHDVQVVSLVTLFHPLI